MTKTHKQIEIDRLTAENEQLKQENEKRKERSNYWCQEAGRIETELAELHEGRAKAYGQIKDLKKQLQAMREVLEWYADEKNWETYHPGTIGRTLSAIQKDGGARATQALEVNE